MLPASLVRPLVLTAFFPVAAVAQFITVIDIDDATDLTPDAIGSQTQLNLSGDGVLGAGFGNFDAGPADGSGFDVEVNVSGGVVEAFQYNANAGSTTNVTGGAFEPLLLNANADSTLNISAGRFAPFGVLADPDSAIHFFGGEFWANGQRVEGLDTPGDSTPVDLNAWGAVAGLLSDGGAFQLEGLTPGLGVTLHRTDVPPRGPAIINAPDDPIPSVIRSGQTLVIGAGAIVPEGVVALGADLRFRDGSRTDREVRVVGSRVEIAGGDSVWLEAAQRSEVRLVGGRLQAFSTIGSGTSLVATGGELSRVTIDEGAKATIAGGLVGSVAAIGDERSGGVALDAGGEVHLLGTEFTLSGLPIEGLVRPGDSVVVTERGGTSSGPALRGLLADGQPFVFYLADAGGISGVGLHRNGRFDPEGTLRLTIVPETTTFALAATALAATLTRGRGSFANGRRGVPATFV